MIISIKMVLMLLAEIWLGLLWPPPFQLLKLATLPASGWTTFSVLDRKRGWRAVPFWVGGKTQTNLYSWFWVCKLWGVERLYSFLILYSLKLKDRYILFFYISSDRKYDDLIVFFGLSVNFFLSICENRNLIFVFLSTWINK